MSIYRFDMYHVKNMSIYKKRGLNCVFKTFFNFCKISFDKVQSGDDFS